MIYAIGAIGEPIRIFINTSSRERALLQRQPGEIALPVEDETYGTIEADGDTYRVVPSNSPLSGDT